MMTASKPTLAVLFLLLIFCFANSCYSLGKNSIIPCPKIEKKALIRFKQSLTDPDKILSSWNTSRDDNCCNWYGVICSNLTGHVHELHLQGDYWFPLFLEGKISPSLLNLRQLKYLDLSRNDFEGTIPSFIGSLTGLEYLNLSNAGFHGMIPHSIGNISNLSSLSLGGFEIFVDSLEWLSGLSQLQHLNMNTVNLSRAANWVQVINTLPSLVELRLSGCSLNVVASLNDVNTTSLAILDLSQNNFTSFAIPKWIFQQNNLIFLDLSGTNFDGPITSVANITKLQYIDLSGINYISSIPNWLYFGKYLEVVSLGHNSIQNTISDAIENLTSLTTLDLSYNKLTGKIPSGIANLSSLTTLDLSYNALTGNIPRGIANLCKMQTLDLYGNMLEGEISDSFGNMSDCFLGALTSLDLSHNQLSGHLTHQFGELKSLREVDLSKNKISGEIPANLGKLSYLRILWLYDNKFTGNLPMSMGQLSNLECLYIGNNMLEGVVTEIHFVNLTKLKYFYASRNHHLTLKVSPNWIPPFKLNHLELGSWNLGTGLHIPSWIDTQKNTLYGLDLSSTGISGNVPTWFWELGILILSHNHLYGRIPNIIGAPESGTRVMYLNSNQFSGSLPRLGNTMGEIDLSNNSFSGGISHFLCDMTNASYRLKNIHLGRNHLTGEIPDCWVKWPLLRMLNLSNNNFSGTIPNSIGFLTYLTSLNLYGNNLSGQIPISVSNCSRLLKMDLSSNNLIGSIPTWIGASLAKLRFLILRSNNLSGVIPSSICHLNQLQILDISDNVIYGIIPACINNFTAMATKRNLTAYIGGELDFSSYYFGNFIEIVSVATKGNEYQYGTILSLVTNIDLSNNNMSGEIPKELTSLVELRSLNLSGNHLTGLIPKRIGDMKQLESLDFSRNSLFGEIPKSFMAMSSLSYLNLSYNHLTGKIPESTQLTGMNSSSFIGNNLCGPPLPTNCSHDDDAHRPLRREDNKGGIDWFYVFLSLGYAMGFSVFCTTLVLKKSWRIAYFGFLESMWNKLYVYFHIKWANITRLRAVP